MNLINALMLIVDMAADPAEWGAARKTLAQGCSGGLFTNQHGIAIGQGGQVMLQFVVVAGTEGVRVFV